MRIEPRTLTIWLMLGLVLSLPSHVRAEPDTLAAEEPAEKPREAYKVTIEGVADGGIRSLLERSSQLVSLRDRAPLTQAGLVTRVEGDFERFRSVLRSEGYYDSEIDYRIDPSTEPTTITIVVNTGTAYQLKAYTVAFVGEAADAAVGPPPLASLGLKLGERARSADVLAAERKILGTLAHEAHPLAFVADREAIVDHDDQSMTVSVKIDPGPFARFGATTIDGVNTVREDYILGLIPWSEGDPYDQHKVEAFREKVIKSGLFSTVVMDRPEQLDPDGTLPMTVRLIEGKQRSVGAGAKYYTSEGPAAEVFWEHRNLFGRSEDLRVTLEVGTIKQQGTIDFVRPDFRRPDQDFLVELQGTRQTTDAFDEIGVLTSAKVRRPLSETWTGSVGTSLEWAQLHDQDGTSSSTLVGLPGSLYRDGTDSRLDPREGVRLRLDGTPYAGWFNGVASFLVSSVATSGYLPLDSERRFVVAGRMKIGSIVGQSRQDIPQNKLFYAGGGDSIRGYQFQKVGPLDSRNDPIGGRSLIEVSAEMRMQVWGNFGLVPFIDGGNVYNPIFPDFSEQLRWAAGIGARYYTVIGPVRFDVAFPLNPRSGIDDPFQFYVSLGQAF